MTKPPSFFAALLGTRCPKCRRGFMFLHRPYAFRHFLRMPTYCPHCAFRFEVEPGFWWGAMYITYAQNTALFLLGLTAYFIWHPPIWLIITLLFLASLVFLPVMVRTSRVLMLYLFAQVRFDPQRYLQSAAENYAQYPPPQEEGPATH